MAKYTMLFAEYLQIDGRTLPTVFEQIDGFSDLFVAHYCDKEIGFETDELFAIKLEERAKIIIPVYKRRIEYYDRALINLDETIKKRTRTYNAGEKNGELFTLPVNAQDVSPSQTSKTGEYTDVTTESDEGLTPDEMLRKMEYYDTLKEGKGILLDYLLNEFSSLFMKVY